MVQWSISKTILSEENDFSQDHEITLFPNPAQDVVSIESNKKIDKIELFDILGRSSAVFINPARSISLATINSGIYTAKITYAEGNYTIRKIQKQ